MATSLEEQHEITKDTKVAEPENNQVEALIYPESRSINDQQMDLSPAIREQEKESEHTVKEDLHEDFKMTNHTYATTEEHVQDSEVQEDAKSEFESNVVAETQSRTIGEQHIILCPALDEQHEESCTAAEKVLAMEEKDEDIETICKSFMETKEHVATSDEVNKDTKVSEKESNPVKIINDQESKSTGEQNAILPATFEERDEESCTTAEYAIPEKDLHKHFKLTEATDETESQIPKRDEIKQDAKAAVVKTNGIEIIDETESTGSHEQQLILASSLEEQNEMREDANVSEVEDNQVEALNIPEVSSIEAALSRALEEQDNESCTNTVHAIKEALHEDFKMTDHTNATTAEHASISDEVQKDAMGEVKPNVVDTITGTQSTTTVEQHTMLSPALEEQPEESCTTAERVLTMEEKDEDVETNCTTNVKTEANATTDEANKDTKVAEPESSPIQIIHEPERRSTGEQDKTLHPDFEEHDEQSCTTKEHEIPEKNQQVDFKLNDVTDATKLLIPTRDEVKEEAEAELQSNGVEIIDEPESAGSHEQQRIMVPSLEEQHDKQCTVSERVITEEEQNEVKEDTELESNQVEIIKEEECRNISEQLIYGTDATELQIPTTDEVKEHAEVEINQVEIIKEKACRGISKLLTGVTDATELQIPTTDEVKEEAETELQSNGVEITDETESTGSLEQQTILATSLEEQHNEPNTISEKVMSEEQNETFKMTPTTETTTDADIATSNEVNDTAEVEIIKKQENRNIGEQQTMFSQAFGKQEDLCASTEHTIKEGDLHKDFNMTLASDTIIDVHGSTGDIARENTKDVLESPQVQITNDPECTSIAEYTIQSQDLEKQHEERATTEEDNDFKINESTGAIIEPNAATSDGVGEDAKIEEGAIIHEIESGSINEQQVNVPPILKQEHEETCKNFEQTIREEEAEVHEEIKIALPMDANTEAHNSACDADIEDASVVASGGELP